MVEKPDYVLNFVRPANTEIKYIRGHWYLYERSNVYDPRLGRSRKKSGKILGSITEQGLVPSRARRECGNPVLNDVVHFIVSLSGTFFHAKCCYGVSEHFGADEGRNTQLYAGNGR